MIPYNLFDGKICSKCGSWEPFSEFYFSNGTNKYASRCKPCSKEDHRLNRPRIPTREKIPIVDGLKRCSGCRIFKPLQEFPKDRGDVNGFNIYCKSCKKVRDQACYNAHKESRAVSRAIYQQKNKEKLRKIGNAWAARNKAKVLNIKHNYRARKKGSTGSHTAQEWAEVCRKYDYRCLACGEKKPLCADHVIPLARGGSDFIDNIQPLCVNCNCRKWAKVIDYRGSAINTSDAS